jgi:type II secretory pathway pseudopilin PulG
MTREGRGQKTEDGGRKTEGGSQKSEDRGLRAEDGRQKTEDRMRTPASPVLRSPSSVAALRRMDSTAEGGRFTFHVSRGTRAFTMVEIAISLAIIGFALVAIIGVLPIGMNVQKDNREETIINQEATVFMEAIRSGAQGVDDLTNYVMAITNSVTHYDDKGVISGATVRYGYTTTNSSTSPPFPLINGARIVGLLSTPKYVIFGDGSYSSNHVVACVRSISGPANEKFPQDNGAVQDFAFSYLMTSEVVPYWTNYVDPSWVNYRQSGLSASEVTARLNYSTVANNLQAKLHDVRLVFRWPLRTQGRSGQSGQSFRALVGGQLLPVADPLRPVYSNYFFQSRTYVKAP